MHLIRFIIKTYRFLLSPIMGNQCRFSPTCSHYAEEAYEKHGVLKGTLLTIIRILRCNPWCTGNNIDDVPKRFAYKDLFRYKHHKNKQKTTPKHRA